MSRYQSLVPLFLAKRFLEGNSYPTDVPFIERYRCSAAFVDISGYSKITSAFDELNTAVELSGAEKVTSLLNDFLDLLFSFTSLYGGDVVKFAGDALLICFFEDDKNSNSEETPTRLVRRACRCALQFQNALEEAAQAAAAGGIALRSHIGIGYGDVWCHHVGGVFKRWEMVFCGDALSQVYAATIAAKAGDVAISKTAWEYVKTEYKGQSVPSFDGLLITELKTNKSERTWLCPPSSLRNSKPAATDPPILMRTSSESMQRSASVRLRPLPQRQQRRPSLPEPSYFRRPSLTSSTSSTSPSSRAPRASRSASLSAANGMLPPTSINGRRPSASAALTDLSARAASVRSVHGGGKAVPKCPENVDNALKKYIPGAVLSRSAFGSDLGDDWTNEIRRCTVLFCNITGLQIEPPDLCPTSPSLPGLESVWSDSLALQTLQTIMKEVQESAYQYEGSVNKFLMDEKGWNIMVLWGLPPWSHENDPERAVVSSILMRKRLNKLGHRCCIGVATGRVFCGLVGTSSRREYTTIGAAVNMAARLMTCATEMGDIRCDAATYAAAVKGSLTFEELGLMSFKGVAAPVNVYRAVDTSLLRAVAPRDAAKASQRSMSMPSQLIGREVEHMAIDASVNELVNAGLGQTLIIDGEPGIGKSAMVEYACRRCESMGVAVMSGSADALQCSTPLFAYRSFFLTLLGFPVHGLSSTDAARTHEDSRSIVENFLRYVPDSTNPASDLSTLNILLLPLELDMPLGPPPPPASPLAAAPPSPLQTALRLLKGFVALRRGKAALVLDDCQWLDSLSWNLTKLFRAECPSALIVLAMRVIPTKGHMPKELDELKSHALCRVLHLAALSADQSLEIIKQDAGITIDDAKLKEAVYERTQGNPLFSHQLARTLVLETCASDALAANGTGPGAGPGPVKEPSLLLHHLTEISMNSLLHGLVIDRVDKLSADVQITLKTSSVLGRVFFLSLLREVHPFSVKTPELETHLHILTDMSLVEKDDSLPPVHYKFTHWVIQDVIYSMMTRSQRCKVHLAIAEWYEVHSQHDSATSLTITALLAHHFQRADDQRAMLYLEKAAFMALSANASREAVAFFSDLLRVHAEQYTEPEGMEICRRANWERHLGIAHNALGDLEQALLHYQNAVELLGYQYPSSDVGLGAGIIRRLLSRFRPVDATTWEVRKVTLDDNGRGRVDATEVGIILDAAACYERIQYLAFILGKNMLTFYAMLKGTALAEAAKVQSAELVRQYSTWIVVADMAGNHDMAEQYAQRVLTIAHNVDDSFSTSHALLNIGEHHAGLGQWDLSVAALEKATALARRHPDQPHYINCATISTLVSFFMGDWQSWRLFLEYEIQYAEKYMDKWRLVGSLLHMASLLILCGEWHDATAVLQHLDKVKLDDGDKGLAMFSTHRAAVLAELAWFNGDHDAARCHNERAWSLLQSEGTHLFFYLVYWCHIVRIQLRLMRHSSSAAESLSSSSSTPSPRTQRSPSERIKAVDRPSPWQWPSEQHVPPSPIRPASSVPPTPTPPSPNLLYKAFHWASSSSSSSSSKYEPAFPKRTSPSSASVLMPMPLSALSNPLHCIFPPTPTSTSSPLNPSQSSSWKRTTVITKQMCKRFLSMSSTWPIFQPNAKLAMGTYHKLWGDDVAAHRLWHEALDSARVLRMPYYEGLAHLMIGEDETGDSKIDHLEKAAGILKCIGLSIDLVNEQGNGLY